MILPLRRTLVHIECIWAQCKWFYNCKLFYCSSKDLYKKNL